MATQRAQAMEPAGEQVLIIDGARTPMGGLGGALASVPAPRLAAVAAGRTLLRTSAEGDIELWGPPGSPAGAAIAGAPNIAATIPTEASLRARGEG